jgi:hypothetical protein
MNRCVCEIKCLCNLASSQLTDSMQNLIIGTIDKTEIDKPPCGRL